MAEVRPFCGIRYNQAMIYDPAQVICPPYDVISPQLRQELHQRSQCNFVRIEDSRELPQDTTHNNKYTRAAATLEQWLQSGILQADAVPAIYLHDHHFTFEGKTYRRRGIIARTRLAGWDEKKVRPHEGTLTRPTGDRLNLLWALQANTSPILALYEDQKQQLAPLLAAQAEREPLISLSSADGERQLVWAITEPEAITQISVSLADQPFYIADGHHRYESALTFRRERHACSPEATGDQPYDYVMMALVELADPGLLILPPHRLVSGVSPANLNRLTARLGAFFDIEALPLATPEVWQQVESYLAADSHELRLVLFGTDRDNLLKLRLRDPARTSQMMPYFHSELYKRLAVSVVDHVILGELLEISSDCDETTLGYSYNKRDAVQRVSDQEYQLAIMVSPIPAGVIKAIADADDRMPRKSTYFYPKLSSGLVFYRLV